MIDNPGGPLGAGRAAAVVAPGPREALTVGDVRVDYEVRQGGDAQPESIAAAQLADDQTVAALPPRPEIDARDVFEPLELAWVLSFRVGADLFTVRHDLGRRTAGFGPWSAVGPFPHDAARPLEGQVFAPEVGTLDWAAGYESPGGPLTWQRVRMTPEGTIPLAGAPEPAADADDSTRQDGTEADAGEGDAGAQDGAEDTGAIVYAATDFQVREACEAEFAFRATASPGLVAWLNGRRIVTREGPRGPTDPPDTARVRLEPGRQTLLLKLVRRAPQDQLLRRHPSRRFGPRAVIPAFCLKDPGGLCIIRASGRTGDRPAAASTIRARVDNHAIRNDAARRALDRQTESLRGSARFLLREL